MADPCPFYIGTMSDHAAGKGIYLGSLDLDTGKLGPITLVAEAKNPNFLAISPDDKFLFAALNDTVASFKIGTDGTLNSLGEHPSGGNSPCHVSVDKTGRHLFVANYGSGNIACFDIGQDGSIGEHTALMQFSGSGPNPKRQKQPYAHSIYSDPENKFVYSCDLGSDSIWVFKYYTIYAALTPADPPCAKVPPGSGPRHLAFDPTGHFVYVTNELNHTVTTFSRNLETGNLTLLQTLSSLPPKTPDADITSSEIVCHPSGKWVFVANRGCDMLSVLDVAPDGTLKLDQAVSSVVKLPRGFALDPTGKWLIAAGQNDNRIVVFKIDQSTGELTVTDQSAEVGCPVCVLFAPKK